MKKTPPCDESTFGWKHLRSCHGTECIHYPSDIARQMLLYPLDIGRARQTPLGVLINHHIQDRYLLHYVVKGEVWHEFHNQTYVARTGDACLMDLSEYIARPAGESRSADIYWVTFNGKDASRCFAELRADRDPVFFALNPSVMEGIFRELLRQTAHEDIASEWRADGLLKLLFAELYAVRAKKHPMVSLGAMERPYSPAVRKGIDWISRCYEERFSVKELCAAVGVSRSHFTRIFRRETGVSPAVWLNRYRLEQAKRLLSTTDKSIAEIAAAVGISDQSYFTRQFHAVNGVTPRGFRKAQERDLRAHCRNGFSVSDPVFSRMSTEQKTRNEENEEGPLAWRDVAGRVACLCSSNAS